MSMFTPNVFRDVYAFLPSQSLDCVSVVVSVSSFCLHSVCVFVNLVDDHSVITTSCQIVDLCMAWHGIAWRRRRQTHTQPTPTPHSTAPQSAHTFPTTLVTQLLLWTYTYTYTHVITFRGTVLYNQPKRRRTNTLFITLQC